MQLGMVCPCWVFSSRRRKEDCMGIVRSQCHPPGMLALLRRAGLGRMARRLNENWGVGGSAAGYATANPDPGGWRGLCAGQVLVQLTGRLAGIGRGFARWALRGVPKRVFRHELITKVGTLSGWAIRRAVNL